MNFLEAMRRVSDRYVICVRMSDGHRFSMNRRYEINEGDEPNDVDLSAAVEKWEGYWLPQFPDKETYTAYWMY